MQGWAQVAQGQHEVGLAQMRRGLAALRATGAAVRLTYYLALLAEACGQTGQAAEGLALLAEALTLVDTTGERWWEAELYRLQGELLLHAECGVRNAESTAEECFQQALDIARRQHARSLELRAAMSLSRLWQRQGKRTEAYQLLAEIYDWFTEGFNTGRPPGRQGVARRVSVRHITYGGYRFCVCSSRWYSTSGLVAPEANGCDALRRTGECGRACGRPSASAPPSPPRLR